MGQTYQVVLTPGAQADIKSIYDYLLENASYQTAKRVKAGLEEEIVNWLKCPNQEGYCRTPRAILFTGEF
jgi:plasmid stabilization system protein ParE